MDMDITKPLPFEDRSVEFILAEHVVEHISAPDALRFFQESHRILEPGGTLRVCCPCVAGIHCNVDNSARIDLTINHGHLQIISYEVLKSLYEMSGFPMSSFSKRLEIDGHWKVIGREKDDLETLRMEGWK